MGDLNKVTTSAVDNEVETTQPEPEAPVTTTEGLQTYDNIATVVVKETSSSIADMIEELSQAGGSEVSMIKAGGVSISTGGVAEGPSQHEDFTEKSHLLLFNQVRNNESLIQNFGSLSCS